MTQHQRWFIDYQQPIVFEEDPTNKLRTLY